MCKPIGLDGEISPRVAWPGYAGDMRRCLLAGVVVFGCSAEPKTWAQRDRDERMAYMQEVVLPTMREIFIAYDPDRYADFSCATCHGNDAAAVDYAMPNALGPLPLDGTLEVAMARNPEMTAFMLDEVFPTMVELLDEQKYNPQSAPNGYRCVGCHLVAE